MPLGTPRIMTYVLRYENLNSINTSMDPRKYITNWFEGLKTNTMCKVKYLKPTPSLEIHTLYCNYALEVLSVQLSCIVLILG